MSHMEIEFEIHVGGVKVCHVGQGKIGYGCTKCFALVYVTHVKLVGL